MGQNLSIVKFNLLFDIVSYENNSRKSEIPYFQTLLGVWK